MTMNKPFESCIHTDHDSPIHDKGGVFAEKIDYKTGTLFKIYRSDGDAFIIDIEEVRSVLTAMTLSLK